MVVRVETDKPGTDVEADARRILLVHRAAPDGLCAGCLEFTCTFAWFPCTQARWAQIVTSDADEAYASYTAFAPRSVCDAFTGAVAGVLDEEPARNLIEALDRISTQEGH